jgi:hypothetical protein
MEPMRDLELGNQATDVIGVSAGALAAVALKLRIPHEKLLNLIGEIGKRKETDFRGVSLVDEMEKEMPLVIMEALGGTPENQYQDYNQVAFQERVKGLKVGVSQRRRIIRGSKAFCYIDQFRDVEDLVAACILSSYIPRFTGPRRGNLSKKHGAVSRANTRVEEMEALGFLKSFVSDQPVKTKRKARFQLRPSRESYIDGGLTHCFPVKDKSTMLVSPGYGRHLENPMIAPRCSCSSDGRRRYWLRVLPKELRYFKARLSLCDCNWKLFDAALALNARGDDVARVFTQGRNDANAHFGSHDVPVETES